MQKIESLVLPDELPCDRAMKSCNQNIHDYEPEFWEFRYEIFRYLKNIQNSDLLKRYKIICRNFEALTDANRNVIPIDSFQSSWYWYKKEHQTRYECFLRRIELIMPPPRPRSFIQAPIRLKNSNLHNLLFRYGALKYMKLFIDGKVRISLASSYKDGSLDDPRTDDELNKHKWVVGDHVKITTAEGEINPFVGDIKETVSQADYYTLCMCSDYEPKIFDEFKYDSCVIIKDPEEFAIRIERNSREVLAGWDFHHNPVEYYDPLLPTKNQCFVPTMCKDFLYAYQKEYRFVWEILGEHKMPKYIDLDLGPLGDICELYVI